MSNDVRVDIRNVEFVNEQIEELNVLCNNLLYFIDEDIVNGVIRKLNNVWVSPDENILNWNKKLNDTAYRLRQLHEIMSKELVPHLNEYITRCSNEL